jgi:acetyltransferase-like isoleucine patch superfamily enzyme
MPSLGRAWRRFAARLVNAVWRWFQQAGTVTGETAAGRRFASFGPGSLIAFPTGSIYGERWIQLGAGTMIGEYASICAGLAPGHDLGPDPVLRIGDRCVIGRGSHIVAHHSIDIGDDVFTGPYVYITDQNHSYADPDLPIGRQWPVNAPVTIGAGTWLGTGVIVLPGSVIGRNVVVAAGAVVRGVIGDRCVVAGVPARIVKDFEPETGWTRPVGGDVGPRSETAPPAPAPRGVGAGETAPAAATLAEGGAPEAIARPAALAEPLLAEQDS